MSPTQRSLALLRERGYLPVVVERWNPYAKIRQDLWGIGDILAIRPGEVLLVQTTTLGHAKERVDKIAESEHIARIREAGIRVEVHGWRKLKSGWQAAVTDCS